jgi:hypothetical protein
MSFKYQTHIDTVGPWAMICPPDGTTVGSRGTAGFRKFVPIPQSDWVKVDSSGTSALAYLFDSATSRLTAQLNPSATGTHKLRKRILLPRDHGTEATLGFRLVTKRSGSITSLKVSILKGGAADATINGSSVSPASAATFELFSFTPGTDYTPGDWVTIEIEYVSSTIGNTVEIGDLEWAYLTGMVNNL